VFVGNLECGGGKADIVLAIDDCRNCWIIRRRVADIAESFDVGPDKVQIGLVRLSYRSRVRFYLNRYYERDIGSAIRNMPLCPARCVNLISMFHEVRNAMFSPDHGARTGACKILLVFTYRKQCVQQNEIMTEASATKAAGIKIIIVNIRNSLSENTVREIASEPTESNVFSVRNWCIPHSFVPRVFDAISAICQTVQCATATPATTARLTTSINNFTTTITTPIRTTTMPTTTVTTSTFTTSTYETTSLRGNWK